MGKFIDSIISGVKILLQSRRNNFPKGIGRSNALVIMGNGPSLNDIFRNDMSILKSVDSMAVNFAANSPEFFELKPRYYTIADPHFYKLTDDSNVKLLLQNLSIVDWDLTLFVPSKGRSLARFISSKCVKVVTFNAVGVEGWNWFTSLAFDLRLGMPRPRNVLIPSIMIGAWMGYKKIYLVGADHSWTSSLSVDDNNKVVTNLPHFYADSAEELNRIKKVYAEVPLHSLFHSYYVAFKAYHEIQRWARSRSIYIYNGTSGSFIDAFPRCSISNVLQ